MVRLTRNKGVVGAVTRSGANMLALMDAWFRLK